MKLNTSKKVYLAVLGVGICALAYDQYNGSGGPADAAAITPDAGAGASSSVVAAGTPAGPTGGAADDLIARLIALRQRMPAGPARDVFAPMPAWVGGLDAAGATLAARADAFRAAHTLKVVVAVGRRGQALVDERLLAVGQSLDEWQLLAVGPGRATFVSGAARAELSLPQSSANAIH